MTLHRFLTALLTATAVLYAGPAFSRDIYVASDASKDAADGSTTAPYPSVTHALLSGTVSGGDRLLLEPGRYGSIIVKGVAFDRPVRIEPSIPGTVRTERIDLRDSAGLHFSDLSVWPEGRGEGGMYLVHARADTRDIRFENLRVYRRRDAPETYLDWSREQWFPGINGFSIEGADITVTGSHISGVAFGILASGPRTQLTGNRIEGFSGDGMRVLGDHSRAVGNLVHNCIKINENHDDGIQSWAQSTGADGIKAINGLVLENNVILEWTDRPDHPLRCKLQGIALFDGFFRDVSIRNNLVAVSHDAYHGISVYGAIGGRIINNTVISIQGVRANSPWLMVNKHKNGTGSRGVTVLNNLSMGYHGIPEALRTNGLITLLARDFVDPERADFRLKPDSAFVDAGRLGPDTPAFDMRGMPRVGIPDLGALESQ